jgi:hypothetical protein
MFLMDIKNARVNAEKLRAIEHVTTAVGRGVYKRIDENRELLELIQAKAPDLLAQCWWIEGWIQSQDDFLTELANAVQVPCPEISSHTHKYPRPCKGKVKILED